MSLHDWLVSEFGVVKYSSADFMVNCPFCKEADTKQHLYVSFSKPVAHCFRCGWKGTTFSLVKELTGAVTNAEVWAILKKPTVQLGDFQTVVEQLKQRKEKPLEQRSIVDMPDWYRSFANKTFPNYVFPVYAYAQRRFSYENIVYHGIGYCADPKHMNCFRMIIPIERGYFQARSLERKPSRKYLNPDFPVGDRVFNYHALRKQRIVMIAEGAISAIALGKNGIATLGNNGATTDQKQRLLDSDAKEFGIGYDAGMEYDQRVLDLADFLSSHGRNVFIRKFAEGDPDSCNVYEDEPFTRKYKVFGMLTNDPDSKIGKARLFR